MLQTEEESRSRDFARFWSQVGVQTDISACWEWTGEVFAGGLPYGRFSVDGKSVRSHRYAYIVVHGSISDELVVRHKCDNPRCCNPFHLLSGTPKQNIADKYERGRAADRRGVKHPLARLSEEQIKEIRQLVSIGHTHNAIAHQYGISRQHVGRIKRGEGWRHI